MHINNPEKTKPINKEGLIYALIFVLYTASLILIFVYAIKFLNNTANNTFQTPNSQAIEAKYGQLDLGNYSLIANKLGLIKGVAQNVITTIPEITAPIAATSSLPEIIASSTVADTAIIASSAPEIIIPTTTPQIIDIKPNIVIINSTPTSGLAAKLKNQLAAIGFNILRTSNSRPSLVNTVIKIKASLNPDSKYLADIKKTVALSYDFTVENLAENSDHDVEIIIGSK